MNREIDKLIFNALATHCDVALPGVGSIVVGRKAARMVAKNTIVGPQTTFSFSSEQRGRSVAEMIVEVSGISEERATDIYNQWLNAVLRDGQLTVEDVGTIEGVGSRAKFVVNEKFDKMINPEKEREYRLNRRINYGLYGFAALCGCVAIGVGLFFVSGVRLNDIGSLMKGHSTATKSAEPKAVAEVVIEECGVRSVECGVGEAEQGRGDTEVCEVGEAGNVEHSSDLVSTLERYDVSTQERENVSTSERKEDTQNSKLQTQHSTLPTPSSPLPSLAAGRSYAVYGVYSKRESADHYLQVVADRYGDVDARIYRYGDRYMIALAEDASRNGCAAKVEKLKSRSGFFASVWVYTEPR